jgi:peptidoglycan/LPS O-acetylase OafA/YrhL
VIVFHLNHELLPGGFTGVDVFFVISGYVISKSLAASEITSLSTFLGRFYRRRILRIVPALLCCLVVSSILAGLFVVPDGWLSAMNDRTALASFFGVSNISLARDYDGYFQFWVLYNPFVHTWSLAVEEQFYLGFPLIMFLWCRSRDRGQAFRLGAACVLPALAAASLTWAWVQTSENPQRAFFLLPSRFWELAAGALLFQLHARNVATAGSRIRARCALYLGAALLLIGFIYADQEAFPFPWALVPVGGTILMIDGVIGTTGASTFNNVLQSSIPTYIGRISYALYLWHWPVFVLLRWTYGLTGLGRGVLALCLVVVLSVVSYHLVENRIRRSESLRRRANWRVICGGLGAVALSYGLIFSYFRYNSQPDGGFNLSVTTSQPCVWPARYNEACNMIPTPATPRVKPNGMRKKHLFVIGDSHAQTYDTMVMETARALGIESVIYRSDVGCSMMAFSGAASECEGRLQENIERLREQSSPGDIVLVASLRLPRLLEPDHLRTEADVLAEHLGKDAAEARKAELVEAIKAVDQLHAMGLYVLIDAPKPIFRISPLNCSDWFNRANPQCAAGPTVDRDLMDQLRAPVMACLDELRLHHGVHIWDPFPVLCPESVCSAYDGDKAIFGDGDHLSGYGNRMLVPSFTHQLVKIWNEQP